MYTYVSHKILCIPIISGCVKFLRCTYDQLKLNMEIIIRTDLYRGIS